MSRIGKAPIVVPKGVTITIQDGNIVTVKGPKGELSRSVPADMQLAQENGQVTVVRCPDSEAVARVGSPARRLHRQPVGKEVEPHPRSARERREPDRI